MGIVTMIKVTRTMPKKMTDANIYSGSVYCDETKVRNRAHQPMEPGISAADYMAVIKRMDELQERVSVLSMKPAMTVEKEEMLNSAISKVDTLEQELMATKKVHIVSMNSMIIY